MLTTRSKLQFLFFALLVSAAPVLLLHTSLYHTGLQSEFVVRLEKFHNDIILSQGMAPFQYRLLAYWLPEWLHRVGVPLHFAYTINRFFWTAGGLVLLFMLFRKWFSVPSSLIGCLLYLALLPVTYFGGGLQPSDAPLFVFFLLGYLVLETGQPGWLVLIIPVGALFHVTIFWLVPLAGLFWGRGGLQPKRLALLGFLVALWFMIYVGVRYLIGPRPLLGQPVEFGNNLKDPYAYINSAVMLSPLMFLRLDSWWLMPVFVRRSLLLAPVVVLLIWLAARPAEARLFLPLAPFLIAIPTTVFGSFIATPGRTSKPQNA